MLVVQQIYTSTFISRVFSLFDDNHSESGERARRELRSNFLHVYQPTPQIEDGTADASASESEQPSANSVSPLDSLMSFGKLLPKVTTTGTSSILIYLILLLPISAIMCLVWYCCRNSNEIDR